MAVPVLTQAPAHQTFLLDSPARVSAVTSPGVTHTSPKKPLWIDSLCDLSSIREELRKPRQITAWEKEKEGEEEAEEGYDCSYDNDDDDSGQFCAGKKNKRSEAKAEDKEGMLVLSGSRRRTMLQQDSVKLTIFLALLKACTETKDLKRGCRVHADIVRMGLLEKNIVIGNAVVSMYAKCGSLTKAQEVCDKLPVRNVVSWNALISGYSQHGNTQQAVECFQQMQIEGVSPNAVTFASILKVCGSIGDADKGQEIHAMIVKEGLLETDIIVGTTLVDMYAKCGLLAKAQGVFDKLPTHNVVSWSVLIAGYAQDGHGEVALACFEAMQLEGICPDEVTFTCILKVCGSIGAIDKGQEIHAQIAREGLLKRNIVVGTALVDMYAKCGLLEKAQEAFDQRPMRDVVLWNTLIAGYAQHGHGEKALTVYKLMQDEGFCPNATTFVCILKACSNIGAADKGQEIHAKFVGERFLQNDIFTGNALLDMYAKCGLLAKAQEVFETLPFRDVVSWSSLIAGYAQHGHGEQALSYFERMQLEKFSPDAVTFVSVLKACGSIGAASKGQEIHAKIAREGFLKSDIFAGNALVDMYAKCGLLAKAHDVFDKLLFRDVVSWNALITGYALLGKAKNVFDLFDKMIAEGVKPDSVTFIIVLNACSYAGLLAKGKLYFETMSKCYGIIPTLEHHTCMVDLLARAGHIEQAVAAIKEMPFLANLTMWLSVLSACQKWGNLILGRLAFEHAVELDEKDAAAYVSMSNIYANAGRQEDADKVEAMRVQKQALMKPEHSWWTDLSGNVHSFYVDNKKHPWSESIYAKLEYLANKMSENGDSPQSYWMSQEMFVDGGKRVLCGHTEKFAIACALISTPKGSSIHVVKDMQTCSSCHAAISLVSKIEKRRILIKDANCFHVFEDGVCACGDDW